MGQTTAGTGTQLSWKMKTWKLRSVHPGPDTEEREQLGTTPARAGG